MPLTIRQGRGFLYDAKLSGNGTGACASCHVDADMDHLAWDLGDRGGNMTFLDQGGHIFTFHPMKGAMTTQTLRRLLNLSPYHWRGDKPDFAAFNSSFDLLMGGSQLSQQDMSTYNAYINSILLLSNPNQNLDRSLPTSFNGSNPAAGRVDFLTVPGTQGKTCNSCHTSNPGAGTNRLVMNIPESSQPLKVPELRNIYQKQLYTRHDSSSIDGFGMGHDGTFSTLADFLAQSVFNGYTSKQKTDMVGYSLCFDSGTAPAVGFTITLTAANVTKQQAQNAWALLQSQASVGNADLIARGTIHGQVQGLLYQPSKNSYLADDHAQYTKNQLQTFIQGGDTLSFIGVYPGTGTANTR